MVIDDRLKNARITPLARRLAAERGFDVSAMRGSGYAGRIFARDLDDFMSSPPIMTEGAAALASDRQTEPIGDLFERPGVLTYIGPVGIDSPAEIVEQGGAQNAPTPGYYTASELFSDLGDLMAEEPSVPEVSPDGRQSTGAMIAAAISADNDVAGVMRMNDVRRSVAESSAKSVAQTAAVTQMMETDITELSNIIERVNATIEKQKQITITAFYLKAMAFCVRDNERFRMRLSEAKDAYLLMDGANIGVQVDIGDGVVTPVIKNADTKPLQEIAFEVVSLSEKAKRGGISESDCKGGAITLLDKGESGIYTFTPIIKQPESAILGIGTPYQRLIMTGKGIENRQFVMQSLTFDHRVINGNEADEFQRRLKEMLEEPGPLFG